VGADGELWGIDAASIDEFNLTQVSKPTRWKAGVSGNTNGRPVGTRQAFSAAFYRDLAEVWAALGKDAMPNTAKTQPAAPFTQPISA
jgi:hypothetical protein